MLFRLAEEYGYEHLTGADFSPVCIDECTAEVTGRGLEGKLFFHTADARDMVKETDTDNDGYCPAAADLHRYPAGHFDIIVDKGCLDCFVSGEGQTDVARYLNQVRCLLTLRKMHSLPLFALN